jgi:hypothetical protein
VPVEGREGWDRVNKKWDCATGGEERNRIRKNRVRKNRGEREIGFPKDLCVISENCRDLFVKHKFLINLTL